MCPSTAAHELHEPGVPLGWKTPAAVGGTSISTSWQGTAALPLGTAALPWGGRTHPSVKERKTLSSCRAIKQAPRAATPSTGTIAVHVLRERHCEGLRVVRGAPRAKLRQSIENGQVCLQWGGGSGALCHSKPGCVWNNDRYAHKHAQTHKCRETSDASASASAPCMTLTATAIQTPRAHRPFLPATLHQLTEHKVARSRSTR